MKLSDMLRLLNIYVDDAIDSGDAIPLLNAGKNKMAIEVKSRFPDLVATTNMDSTFVFDEEYHELPVLYAAGMIKAQDSAVREKDSYMMQFESGIKNFSENYDPPAQYLNVPYAQHFTAKAGDTAFVITKNDYNPKYGNLRVYRNSKEYFDFSLYDHTITLNLLFPALEGEVISAVWENHPEYQYAPSFYPSWG